MKSILIVAFLFALIELSAATCGDDVCGSGENCSSCIWDCGVCNSTEGSGGGSIGTAPAPKTVSIWDGISGYHKCPLSYSSYVSSGSVNTSVRIKILNNYSSSTNAFRLSLSSSLSWFVPKNITFSFGPDGYTNDGKPFWDVPGLGPNESTEVSFVVKGSVGLVDRINVTSSPLERWPGGCKYFVPISVATMEQNITKYLESINQSQDIIIFYTNGNLILTYLKGNSSFAVFGIYGTNVTPVSDNNSIEATVSAFLKAASPTPSTDPSKPFQILNYSRILKQGPEKNCMMITGMDKHNCTDRTSCRYACASVPVCWYIGQVGWPFIDAMLDYRKTIDKADIELDRAINSSLLFSQSPSNGAANATMNDLKSLNRAETAVIYHPLFTTYNFCPPPEYAIPQQIEAKRQLLDYQEENCAWQQQGRIVNESVAMSKALKTAESDFLNRTMNMSANITANATGNVTTNITANATGNASANVTGNATVNVTTNMTANVTANVTSNVTSNATANASSNQNASLANATTSTDETETFANEIRDWINKADVCSGVSLPLSALLALCIFRNSKK